MSTETVDKILDAFVTVPFYWSVHVLGFQKFVKSIFLYFHFKRKGTWLYPEHKIKKVFKVKISVSYFKT